MAWRFNRRKIAYFQRNYREIYTSPRGRFQPLYAQQREQPDKKRHIFWIYGTSTHISLSGRILTTPILQYYSCGKNKNNKLGETDVTLKTFKTKNMSKIVELVQSTNAGTPNAESKPAQVSHTSINNNPVLKTPINGFDAAFKRLCDLIIGGVALIVLMPFFALLAILIKLDSTGPALFSQQRSGRNRQPIRVYKFRTMHQNYSTPVPTATSFIQTQKNDPRVTRLGVFLRKASLDELPQLFNVMEGSMSLVGPRPHPFPLDEQFKNTIPELASRYAVKPGLTGWAQINGFRGETVRIEDMAARVEHDCHYIKNWTLWLDIKIIARTAFIGWTHRNAY